MFDMFSDRWVDNESDTAKPSTSLTSEAATSDDLLPEGKQFKTQLKSYVGSGVRNTRCEGFHIAYFSRDGNRSPGCFYSRTKNIAFLILII